MVLWKVLSLFTCCHGTVLMSKHKPNLVQLEIFFRKWPTYLKGFVISVVGAGFTNCHCCLFNNGSLF